MQLDHVLREIGFPKDMKMALSNLPTSPNAEYSRAMKRIEKKEEKKAMAVLSWVYHVFQPLNVNELRQAKSIERGQTKFDKEIDLPDEQKLIDTCEGLVKCEKDGIVQFAHSTIREYLRQNYENRLLSHTDIAWTCVTCLGFEKFDELSIWDINNRSNPMMFGRYAAQYWADHTRRADRSDEIQAHLIDLLRRGKKRRSMEEIHARIHGASLLHVVAGSGLVSVCKWLLKSSVEFSSYVSRAGLV